MNNELLRVLPDTGAIQRTGLRNPAQGNWPLFLPAPDGSVWLAGSVYNGLLPVTANAAQSTAGRSPLLRISDGTVTPPAMPVAAHQVRALATGPADRSRISAATDGGVFLSEDNGANWSRVFELPAQCVLVDPFDSQKVYLGMPQTFPAPAGIFQSTDGGHSFAPMQVDGLNVSAPITSLAADLFIAGTTGPGLPLTNAFQPAFGGGKSDAFLAEFDSGGDVTGRNLPGRKWRR